MSSMHWLQTGCAGKSATHSLIEYLLTHIRTYFILTRGAWAPKARGCRRAEPIVHDYKVDKSSESGGEQRGGEGGGGGGEGGGEGRGAVLAVARGGAGGGGGRNNESYDEMLIHGARLTH
jgi:hypothetical protein